MEEEVIRSNDAPRIIIADYKQELHDIYYSIIPYIQLVASRNFNPMDVFNVGPNQRSDYANAIIYMKTALKNMLDYLNTTDKVYLKYSNKEVELSKLTFKEQEELILIGKEYITENLLPYIEQCRNASVTR